MTDYRRTTLWITAFASSGLNADQRTAREELLATLGKLDDRVASLLGKIEADCHELTIHDISHVHQLWEVASQICGDGYPINPLEGFVLGASFLIHDAGLTAAAYPDGLIGLRRTKYYRDRVATLVRSASNAPPDKKALENPSNEIAQRALFDTLRAVHAKRAETLLDESKSHPLTGMPYAFFPDPDLYLDCGEIIGPIAASHYWNIEDVDARFQDPLTPPAKFPGWKIDALKLACILRTADACAIDERRARIMPFLLSNPSGISRDHWIFQANLKPGERREEAIVFQSKWPFARQNMSAWWVAYDAVNIADRELRNCDRLLRDRATSGKHLALKAFSARRVEGAGEPMRLKDEIRVSGWEPVDTSVRIGNPIGLVEKLGGWHLYGNDSSAPLREALQNAADAIRARRRPPNGYIGNAKYPGRIDVRLECNPKDETLKDLKLLVADDGIGMSSDVMTGTLLDFGRSFWDSGEAAEKYPGLLSDPLFRPTGKFGIGFYSIFMIADDVKIISRPWDAGINDAKVLHFHSGAKGRAEFRNVNSAEDGTFHSTYSTVLIANVKYPKWLQLLTSLSDAIRPTSTSMDEFWKDFVRVSKELVFALDVECWLSYGGLPVEKLNEPGVLDLPSKVFAQRFNETFTAPLDPITKGFTPEEIPLIASIGDAQKHAHTRGCIATDLHTNGHWHIGGFNCFRLGDSVVKGTRAGTPLTASRNMVAGLASKKELNAWGKLQLKRVIKSSLDPMRKVAAIANLSSIDVNIRNHAMIIVDGIPLTIADMVKGFGQKVRIFVMGLRGSPSFSKAVFMIEPSASPFFGFAVEDLKSLKQDFRIWGSSVPGRGLYFEILGDLNKPTNHNSAYGALYLALKDAGFEIRIEGPGDYVIGVYDGPRGGRSYLSVRELVKGVEIKKYGFIMHAERHPPRKSTKRLPRAASRVFKRTI